jgi:hypothetical protein
MTLFISWLLIFHIGLEWWWYLIALGLWAGKLVYLDITVKANIKSATCRYIPN